MSITLDSETARDLIETKLRVLTEKIEKILKKWNINSIDEFIKSAKTGTLSEAENDAIDLQNLRDKRNEIEKLLLGLQWMILLSEELILKVYDIILKELRGSISEIDLDEDTGKLVMKLKSGVTVFIRYNNYGQFDSFNRDF